MSRAPLLGALFSIALAAACDRTKAVEPEKIAPPPAQSTAPTPSPAALSTRLSRPAAPKVVAIGDLHGDLDATRKAFRLAGAIDEKDKWSGGSLVVVQTGDAIDRGDDDRKILDLLERLKGEAKTAGGELIAMSGNHELMNVALDFRYVTPGALTAFDDVRGGRASAFAPGGPYATMFVERPIVMKVGDTVFAHGGILAKHVKYGLDRMDKEVSEWLLGKRPECPAIVSAEDGPVWTRMYSASTGREECDVLTEALRALGAKRMVVAHTVQRNGINAACNDRVWRIDTGMTKVFEGKIEVLEIAGDAATVKRLATER